MTPPSDAELEEGKSPSEGDDATSESEAQELSAESPNGGEAPLPQPWTVPSPASEDTEQTTSAETGDADSDLREGSAMAPLRAMRRIKLSQSAPRPPQSSSPEIETSEASLSEVEELIQEEELGDLEPTPAPPTAAEMSLASHVEAAASDESVGEQGRSESAEQAGPVSAPVPLPPHEAPDLDAIEDITPEPSSPDSEPPEDFDVPPAERKPPPPRRSAKPSLPQAQKPRKKPWWETLFGDDFSRAYRAMTPSQLSREVDFIIEGLELPPGSVLLDLGCGQGEICVELARRGYSVVGYDLSVFQLAMAGDLAQQAKQKINFLQGDMREMAFDGMFDGVICWDTSFGYFEEDKNAEVLRRVFQALKPNGRFLLDILNRDFVAAQAPYSHWFEGDGCVCMDDMNMDWITNRMKVKRSIILDDGRSKELHYSVRLYGLSDIGRLLHDVGFRVSKVSGDVATKGAFFGPCSRRIVIEAARP